MHCKLYRCFRISTHQNDPSRSQLLTPDNRIEVHLEHSILSLAGLLSLLTILSQMVDDAAGEPEKPVLKALKDWI